MKGARFTTHSLKIAGSPKVKAIPKNSNIVDKSKGADLESCHYCNRTALYRVFNVKTRFFEGRCKKHKPVIDYYLR